MLRDGKVLVLVGNEDGGPRSAEVYDPASGTWTATGPMDPGAEESDDAFTVLRDGRVLVAGRDGAQVYDPASGTWTATGPMVRGSGWRHVHGAPRRPGPGAGDGAQVYDPASGTWTATGKMNGDAYRAAAALLSDGKVLVAGGSGFGPPSDRLLPSGLGRGIRPRHGVLDRDREHAREDRDQAAFLQPDGKVLVVGSAAGPLSTLRCTTRPPEPGPHSL